MKKLFLFIRSNHLIILSFLVFITTIVLILLEIDRQRYQVRKKEIIIQYWEQLFPDLTKEAKLNIEAQRVFLSRDNKRDEALKYLETLCTKILNADNCIYRIELFDKNQKKLFGVENLNKVKHLNTFKNSLILKNFYGKQIQVIPDPDFRRNDILGRIIITYSSPINFPVYPVTPLSYNPIERLTAKYRYYCILIIASLSLIYFYLLKALLLPVKRVIACLDKESLERPELLKNPRSLLERVFNNLTREAILNHLNQKLQKFASTSTTLDTTTIFEELPEFVVWLLRFKEAVIFEFRKNAEGIFNLVTSFYRKTAQSNLLKSLEKLSSEYLNQMNTRTLQEPKLEPFLSELKYQISENSANIDSDVCYLAPIEMRNNGDIVTIMALVPGYSSTKSIDVWKRETFQRVLSQVKNGIKQIEFQRKIIFKEKSEANISLSRNLGHDLTNIIATSKLDLLAVQHFLSLPGEEIMSNPQKEKIFKEALSGLLNNTKFLQEIVNLYRSFGYIKRPKFEVVNLNQVLDEIVTIFDMSITKDINIIKRYNYNIPPIKIEQRLVKLAVFNILSNAVDSIKRKASESNQWEGDLILTTSYDKENEEVILSIKDNGTGIKNQRGEIALPHEIDRVFYLGYTTKKDEEGEGLGLNWVWSIIHDFHQGRIIPRNCPEGGAEFTIHLKKDFEPQSAIAEEKSNPFESEMFG